MKKCAKNMRLIEYFELPNELSSVMISGKGISVFIAGKLLAQQDEIIFKT